MIVFYLTITQLIQTNRLKLKHFLCLILGIKLVQGLKQKYSFHLSLLFSQLCPPSSAFKNIKTFCFRLFRTFFFLMIFSHLCVKTAATGKVMKAPNWVPPFCPKEHPYFWIFFNPSPLELRQKWWSDLRVGFMFAVLLSVLTVAL